MRMLVLDQFSELGGAQLCLLDVLREAGRRGWEVEAMAPGNGPLLDFARECGFSARRLPIEEYSTAKRAARDLLRFGSGVARGARLVRKVLAQRPADLIYVNGPRVLPLAIQSTTPVLFHAHSVLTSRYASALGAWSLRRAGAAAVACSEFAAGPVRSALGGEPVQTIYNGVADCGFRPRAAGAGIRVGLVGRIAPEKGQLDFIEAARRLEGKGLRFVIAGASLFSDRRYEQKVRTLGAQAGVEFRDWTDDIASVLHDLDILAVPSALHEASTRVILEALSAGTCVAAYPSGGVPELVTNGVTGLLTQSADPAALASAIRDLAANAELRAKLADNGRKEWQARFTVERFQREVCDRLEAEAGLPARGASAGRSRLPDPEPAHDARIASP